MNYGSDFMQTCVSRARWRPDIYLPRGVYPAARWPGDWGGGGGGSSLQSQLAWGVRHVTKACEWVGGAVWDDRRKNWPSQVTA